LAHLALPMSKQVGTWSGLRVVPASNLGVYDICQYGNVVPREEHDYVGRAPCCTRWVFTLSARDQVSTETVQSVAHMIPRSSPWSARRMRRLVPGRNQPRQRRYQPTRLGSFASMSSIDLASR